MNIPGGIDYDLLERQRQELHKILVAIGNKNPEMWKLVDFLDVMIDGGK